MRPALHRGSPSSLRNSGGIKGNRISSNTLLMSSVVASADTKTVDVVEEAQEVKLPVVVVVVVVAAVIEPEGCCCCCNEEAMVVELTG